MKFDIVIGNPPYTKDIYLDFVINGHKLSKSYDAWITPAKWHTKGDDTNHNFREQMEPYIDTLVYYPDCIEIFAISDNSGITYYINDKKEHPTKNIVNKAYFQRSVNSTEIRPLSENDTLWNIGVSILNKVNSVDNSKYTIQNIEESERKAYTICMAKQWGGSRLTSGAWDMQTSKIKKEYVGKGGCVFNPDGTVKVLGKTVKLYKDEQDSSNSSVYVFTSDNEAEADSFYSWINTKLISFLILINLSTTNILKQDTFKYVPNQTEFNHIFSDKELYDKYGLNETEINIIEAIIRLRSGK